MEKNRIVTLIKQWGLAVRDRELPLRQIQSRPPFQSFTGKTLIPPIVFQSWQDNRVGRQHKRIVEEFRAQNPNIDFRLYTNDDQYDFMRTHFKGETILDIFEGSLNGVMRADVFRYSVLYKQGGIYLDFSKKLNTPIQEFLELGYPFVLSHERNLIPSDLDIETRPIHDLSENLYVQWCLMAAPGHPFLARMLDNICREAPKYDKVQFRNPKLALLNFTSSYMWTRSVWQELLRDINRSDYVLVAPDYGEDVFPLIPESYARYLLVGHYSGHRNQVVLDLGSTA